MPEPHRLLKYIVNSRHANTSEYQRCKESHFGVVVKTAELCSTSIGWTRDIYGWWRRRLRL